MRNFANKTITELLKTEICRDIMRGVFAPEQKLSIKLLTQHYNAGSSPIREALSRLVATGMVVSLGQKGFYTPTTNYKDFTEIATALTAINNQIFNNLESTDTTAATEILIKLENWHNQSSNSSHDWVNTRQNFYNCLANSCNSGYLFNFYLQLNQHVERYQHQILIQNNNPEINLRPIREKQIIQALNKKDISKAQQLIAKSLQKNLDTIISQLQKPTTTSVAPKSNLQQWQPA